MPVNIKDEIRKSTLNKDRTIESEMAIADILPNPDPIRTVISKDKLNALADTIKREGVIQSIAVQKRDGKVYLVAGDRRFKAAQIAGIKTVPVKFIPDNADAILIAVLENVQRESPHPIDEAQSFLNLQMKYKISQQKLAELLGKGRTTVTEILSITKLPDVVKKECLKSNKISRNQLVNLVKLENEDEQLKWIKSYLKEPTENNPKKLSVSKPIKLADKTIKLAKQIGKLKIEEISDEEKLELQEALKKMLAIITKSL